MHSSSSHEPVQQERGHVLRFTFAVVEHERERTGCDSSEELRTRSDLAVSGFDDSELSCGKSVYGESGYRIKNRHRELMWQPKANLIHLGSERVEPGNPSSFRVRHVHVEQIRSVAREVETEEPVLCAPPSRHVRFKRQVLQPRGAGWNPFNCPVDGAGRQELRRRTLKPHPRLRKSRQLKLDHLIPQNLNQFELNDVGFAMITSG